MIPGRSVREVRRRHKFMRVLLGVLHGRSWGCIAALFSAAASALAGWLAHLLQWGEDAPWICGIVVGLLSIGFMAVLHTVLKQYAYWGVATRCEIPKLEELPVMLKIAFREHCSVGIGGFSDHLRGLDSKDGLHHSIASVYDALLVIRVGVASTRVKEMWHIWNDQAFPVDEYWDRQEVREFSESMKGVYKEQPGISWGRFVVIDDDRLSSIEGNPVWKDFVGYHGDKLYRIGQADWARMTEGNSIQPADAAMGIGRQRLVFMSYVVQQDGSEGERNQFHFFRCEGAALDEMHGLITELKAKKAEYAYHLPGSGSDGMGSAA